MIKKSLNSDIFGLKRSNHKDFGLRALEAIVAPIVSELTLPDSPPPRIKFPKFGGKIAPKPNLLSMIFRCPG